MRDSSPQTVYLKDYKPFEFDVDAVSLTFDLDPHATRVTSRITFAPKSDSADRLFLHGEGLNLIEARIDGHIVTPDVTPEGLECAVPNRPFVWEAVVEIDPANNTALEGLYMSGGMYCTQCEAEGFRKITYYPDRPDVMSIFTVRINGPHPVLLSNGNPVRSEPGVAEWHDPWPKPAYLFALVAGDLKAHTDSFTTQSGRPVELNLYVRPGDEDKCAFGMEALKKSMRWDEEVYGREYDLDVFNIVAVDDFNMGAMENKGLNIFNSSAVLASPETSTDGNFERIEAIIAHEYFHNWTGNRITCRDWFQLCLKEGLTVYRDSQFTSDMRSAAVKRISDVIDLRARQFAEDQGPLSHPVRPESFQEINNFYTATVYEKGAEVIGMLRRLVGADAYSKALDLYFDRHDGEACTIEDWLKVFEDTTRRDLSQFKRWYSQAGTPTLAVEETWESGTYTLKFTQDLKPSATTPDPQPQVIPIVTGLLDPSGTEVRASTVLEMTEREQSFTFTGLESRPVPSILREFSAPVRVEHAAAEHNAALLLAHDTDPFNRWEAGRTLARGSLMNSILKGSAPDDAYIDGLRAVLSDDALDPAFRALMLGLPSQSELANAVFIKGETPDPSAIYAACETMREAQASAFDDLLPVIYATYQIDEPFQPTAQQAGFRALSNAVLALLTRRDGGTQALEQFHQTDNMTQQLAAFSALLRTGHAKFAIETFEKQWKSDRLVMDKWFAMQTLQAEPQALAGTVTQLTAHDDFNWKNPNRFRAVLGAMTMNHAGFHEASGAAYSLMADWLIRLDPVNPQTTARMCSAFQTWRRYDAARQEKIAAALDRILAVPQLSRDTNEMITRIRNAET
jgi:aminopeptidase N